MKPLIVGIAGGTASGKSTISKATAERLGAALIGHDRYYHDVRDKHTFNFDHPDSLDTTLMVEHLRQLHSGQAAELPVYEFATHSRSNRTERVEPGPVILVEGILVLADAGLRSCFDMMVWVEAPADIRLIRRMRRDIAMRGRTWDSVLNQYEATVRPMHEQWVAPSAQFASIILDGTIPTERAVTELVQTISLRVGLAEG